MASRRRRGHGLPGGPAGWISSRHPSPSVLARRNRAFSHWNKVTPKSMILAYFYYVGHPEEAGTYASRASPADLLAGLWSRYLSPSVLARKEPNIFTPDPRNVEILDFGTLSLWLPSGGSGDTRSTGISDGPTGLISSRRTWRNIPECPRSKKPGIFTPESRNAKIHDFGLPSLCWPPGGSGGICFPGISGGPADRISSRHLSSGVPARGNRALS